MTIFFIALGIVVGVALVSVVIVAIVLNIMTRGLDYD